MKTKHSHTGKTNKCEVCDYVTGRTDNLKLHVRSKHTTDETEKLRQGDTFPVFDLKNSEILFCLENCFLHFHLIFASKAIELICFIIFF